MNLSTVKNWGTLKNLVKNSFSYELFYGWEKNYLDAIKVDLFKNLYVNNF